MRTIKFRAWDIKYKRWLTPEAIATNIILNWNTEHADGIFWMDEFDGRIAYDFGTDFEVMQFTGLLDKNGKEIYEGDVVLLWDEPDRMQVIDDLQQAHALMDECILTDSCRVIGNVHENPELLKERL